MHNVPDKHLFFVRGIKCIKYLMKCGKPWINITRFDTRYQGLAHTCTGSNVVLGKTQFQTQFFEVFGCWKEHNILLGVIKSISILLWDIILYFTPLSSPPHSRPSPSPAAPLRSRTYDSS